MVNVVIESSTLDMNLIIIAPCQVQDILECVPPSYQARKLPLAHFCNGSVVYLGYPACVICNLLANGFSLQMDLLMGYDHAQQHVISNYIPRMEWRGASDNGPAVIEKQD